jgi:glycosyltransferase involved in cell wall biosynthesis
LVELGYDVDVLTYPFGEELKTADVHLTRIPNVLGLNGVPIGFSWRKLWLDLFLFSAVARRLESKRYACVSAVEEAAFVAALVAPRFGVPVLYDMQSSLAEQLGYISPFRNGIARHALDWCERWLLGHVELTMTSAGLAQRVRRCSPDAPVHEWCYPGLTDSADPAEVDRLRGELDLDDAPVAMYAGNFAEYQGLQELIDAWAAVLERVPEAVLVLVGAGSDAELGAVRSLAAPLPTGSFRILPRQPRDEMPAYLTLADVLVSPRQFGENLPLKVLDYLAAGRAVVATDIPAHRTVLVDDVAAIVPPDPESMAGAIADLLQDHDRREGLARRARGFARDALGWLTYVQSVGKAFEKICGYDDRR